MTHYITINIYVYMTHCCTFKEQKYFFLCKTFHDNGDLTLNIWESYIVLTKVFQNRVSVRRFH